ncbi:MAG: hypothetical protein Q9212_001136 [Teloschistes hypoglaucus]
MALLDNHLEQISLSAAAIAELPFPPPKKFTNALLRSKDITALIRDTEAHERALFKFAPSDSALPPNHPSAPRRPTVYEPGSGSGGEHFLNGVRITGAFRQKSAVSTLLGSELGEQLRTDRGQAGKERGEVDVDLLLQGAERLCAIYPIAGAKDRIVSLRPRFDQLTSSIARYEARVSKHTSQLAKMNRRGDLSQEVDDYELDEHGSTRNDDATKLTETLITVEDLEKEEQEIRELERKKRALEDRVSGMERDLGGLLRHCTRPTSAVIALKANVEVTVVDINADRIAAWQSDELPIYEPGLYEVVRAARDGVSPSLHDSDQDLHGLSPGAYGARRPNLFFSANIDQAIMNADLIFVCVNTPTKAHGIGKGSAADLDFVEAATRNIARVATQDKIVVEKSTVPCKTAQAIREILAANAHPGVRFDVLSNPEFLAEGTAIRDLLHPDRIIIGSTQTREGHRAAASLAAIYEQWVPQERIVTMNLWSSELSKLAANALLAQRISSVNALSAICEATGANVDEVSHACGLDSRIGPHMLKAGPGFGGSCFQKDIFNIVYLSESLHLYEVADYWRAIINMNEHQKQRFTRRIISCMYNNLAGKKLAILGFAFKKDTSDTRESPAITLVSNFIAERARVAIYDPRVPSQQIWRELVDNGCDLDMLKRNVSVCPSAYAACEAADAVIVLTDWDEFSNTSVLARTPSKEPQQPLASLNVNKNVRSAMLWTAGPEPASPFQSPLEDAPSFQIPSRKSSGITIKDPKSGEIKKFPEQRNPSIGHSVNLQSPLQYEPSPLSRLTIGQPNEENIVPSGSLLGGSSVSRTMPSFLGNATGSHLPQLSGVNQDLQAAIEITTRPASFNRLDWARVAKGMRKPMFVFDGRNMLDHAKLEALGFRVESIGKKGTAITPQGLPPIQTLVRAEQIMKLANLPEEKKPAYIQGVSSLWDRLKKSPPDSQEYHEAYRKLHEASESLKRTMNQARAAQNAPRPNNPAQPAQPAGVRQPTQSGGQRPVGEQQFSAKVVDNVRKQPFYVPADIAAQGQERALAWQRDQKQKYALTLHKFETSQNKLQELHHLLQNKEGKMTAAEQHSLNTYKTDHEKASQQARDYLTQFRQNQDRIRASQKQAGIVNPSGADAARVAGVTGSSAEHPQSVLEPQNSHASTVANTVSDHQGQTHTVSSALDAARNHPSVVGRPGLSVENGGQVNQGPVTQAATTQAPEGQVAAASEHSQTTQNVSRAPGTAPTFHSPASTNPTSNNPQGPHPLSHQAAISQSQSARSYSQHTNQNPAVQASTHAHPQPSVRDTQNNNTKMPIPKDLKVAQPQPVSMGPARPTLTGGPSNGASGPMGQPAIQKHPGYVLEGDGERVMGRKKLEELVRQVTGGVDGEEGETLSAAAEETLLDVADDFVDQVVTAACKLAKLRTSQTLELRDIQLVLERNYNIRIPGYASDELRTVKKVQPTPGWTQKLAAVQAAKVTGGKGDI